MGLGIMFNNCFHLQFKGNLILSKKIPFFGQNGFLNLAAPTKMESLSAEDIT